MADKKKLASISKKLAKYIENKWGDSIINVDIWWTQDDIEYVDDYTKVEMTYEYSGVARWVYGEDEVSLYDIRSFLEDKCFAIVDIERVKVTGGDDIVVVIQYK